MSHLEVSCWRLCLVETGKICICWGKLEIDNMEREKNQKKILFPMGRLLRNKETFNIKKEEQKQKENRVSKLHRRSGIEPASPYFSLRKVPTMEFVCAAARWFWS
mmetsp:Transcript_17919/g.28031  ORF Transcript_17919/g.28031 Transcript_17919/m.28031 type:complete len:105 (+) Transcript_17919:91-405(+)